MQIVIKEKWIMLDKEALDKYRYPALVVARRIPNGRYEQHQPMVQGANNDELLLVPAHGTYGGLLFDQRWKTKRGEIVRRDGGHCVICNSTEELQVHHRQYQFIKQVNAFKMPWDYPDHLLITLCKNCHNRGHSKFKVPTLIIP
ncbi:MAG: HNH endonuclease [Mucilaginibacter sp.]